MRFLITGGCGFLGSNLAHKVLTDGQAELTVFDNLSRLGSQENLAWLRGHGEFRFIHGDIRNAHDVDRLVADFGPDVIFHLAGQVAMTTSLSDPRRDFETNTVGTFNLLEAVRRHAPGSAVLYSSTNKVYGDLEYLDYREGPTRYELPDYPNGFPESLPLNFRTPYGTSKGSADQFMLDYARSFGLRTVVFRHSSMYGGRQFATVDQGWIGWFCAKVLQQSQGSREVFTISGNGKQVRDLLHADDMVRLYFSAAAQIDAIAGRAFNVGGGMSNSLSILELLHLLGRLCGQTPRFEHLPPRCSDQKLFVADTSALAQAIGWRPMVDRESGIRLMLGWVAGTES